MKNKITDLNNHLFEQLERLKDEDISGSALKEELEKTKAIVQVADKIVGVAKITLDAAKALNEGNASYRELETFLLPPGRE